MRVRAEVARQRLAEHATIAQPWVAARIRVTDAHGTDSLCEGPDRREIALGSAPLPLVAVLTRVEAASGRRCMSRAGIRSR